ncbi:aminotransferase class V-fold PLP-dependent enzyme [Metamycoplasma alkalescens]|uniref:aminotransferase class V-fold PLP-dependent enzyme n=1 Tax=Metamycoplasma alkalescens TaxID=45363 RepID=UPI003D00548F
MFKIAREKIFPMFKNNPNIVYLDNAALAFKPISVINKGNEFYEKYSISTRTADSKLGIRIDQEIKSVRNKIAKFLNANEDEVIFTQGTTDGLNQIAKMLANIIDEGEIIFSFFNHSSAIVPFLENFNHKKIKIKYCLDEKEILLAINQQTKIIVIPQVSNNFQANYNLKKIYAKCKEYNTILINDAAQAIVHEEVDFEFCDVLVFSGNKIYGPTGTGALLIKKNLLNQLSLVKWGGGQVQNIFDDFNWNVRNSINKWEPGTPNFAGLLQLGEAISFFLSFDIKDIIEHEKELAELCFWCPI